MEPHRFSRLHSLLSDFTDSLKIADSIFILSIYTAGEKNLKKIDSSKFYFALKKKFQDKTISLVKMKLNF